MNDIIKARYEIICEVEKRMNYDDYDELNYADIDKLVQLKIKVITIGKRLKPPKISVLDSDREETYRHNARIEKENKKIYETMKPYEKQIGVLEVEIILYSGIESMIEVSDSINKRIAKVFNYED